MNNAGHRSATILVVDDDAALCDSIRVLLESCGYRVAVAENATAAMATLSRSVPDLVLTDIYMPGSDGFELINALRKLAPKVPVVAMSGGGISVGRYDNLTMATHLGAQAAIDKPFSDGALLEVLDRVLPRA